MIIFCIMVVLDGARNCIDGVYDIHLVFSRAAKMYTAFVRRLKLM